MQYPSSRRLRPVWLPSPRPPSQLTKIRFVVALLQQDSQASAVPVPLP